MNNERLFFKVYIEGVAVKFFDASVSATVGNLSSASVSLPYSKYVSQLRPRSVVTITYGTLGEDQEYVLFDGDLLKVVIPSGVTNRTATLHISSPLSALKRYRKYVDTSIVSPITSASILHLNPDSKKREVFDLGENGIPGADSDSATLLQVLNNKNASFPGAVHDTFKNSVRSSKLLTNEVTTIASHERIYGYADQFEAVDMYAGDSEWQDFRDIYNFQALVQSIPSMDGLSNPDYYTFMTSVYSNFNYTLTDLGVPHVKVDTQTEEEQLNNLIVRNITGVDNSYFGDSIVGGANLNNSSRFLLHPSSSFLNPPACNIVLPDILLGTTIVSDFSNEITRASLVSSTFYGVDESMYGLMYPSPSSQFDKLTTDTVNEFLVDSSQIDESYGNNEIFLGPKGFYQNLPIWYSFRDEENSSIANSSDFLTKYSDLYYLNSKYYSRAASIATIFNPKMCVGLPMVVLDPSQPFFSCVNTITHSFNSNGNAKTNVSGTHTLLPLDFLNPDLRNANGFSDSILNENIGFIYKQAGLGTSYYDFTLQLADYSFEDKIESVVTGIIDTLKAENRIEEASTIEREQSSIIDNIRKNINSQSSSYSSKIDEGYARLLGIEILLDKIRIGGLTDETLNEHLRLNEGRQPVEGNAKIGPIDWSGDPSTQTGGGREYWISNSSTGPHHEQYLVRRKAAEVFAMDINKRGTDPESKSNINIANSLIAAMNDTISPKTAGEIRGRDQ